MASDPRFTTISDLHFPGGLPLGKRMEAAWIYHSGELPPDGLEVVYNVNDARIDLYFMEHTTHLPEGALQSWSAPEYAPIFDALMEWVGAVVRRTRHNRASFDQGAMRHMERLGAKAQAKALGDAKAALEGLVADLRSLPPEFLAVVRDYAIEKNLAVLHTALAVAESS